MDERAPSAIGRYRGPAITVGLALSLIAALAIPSYVGFQEPAPVAYDLRSREDATVSEVLIQPNQLVRRGDPLVLLVSENLEKEIADAKAQVTLEEMGTKAAIADPTFLGSIGTVRTVVVDTPVESTNQAAVVLPATEQIDPKVQAEIQTTRKQLDGLTKQAEKIQTDLPARETQREAAKKSLEASDQAVESALAFQATQRKDAEKMQRLFDMGAIAKRRLDASKAALALADQEAAEAQTKREDLKSALEGIEKDLADLTEKLAAIKQDLGTMSAKLPELESKLKVKVAAPPAQPAPKPMTTKKKIFFGSTPIGSTAPVSVKLVDTNDPAKEKALADAKARLQALLDRQSNLKLTAPFDGRIKEIKVKKGTALHPDEIIVTLEAAR